MKRWLKRLLGLGLWRVHYKDGQVSVALRYQDAKSRAELFDGRLEFVE